MYICYTFSGRFDRCDSGTRRSCVFVEIETNKIVSGFMKLKQPPNLSSRKI